MTSWGETQLLVARDFQAHALPRYLVPYPPSEDGYYGHDQGSLLTHAAYARAVAAGRLVARPLHGGMHAARVTLYCALLAQLHRRAGRNVPCLYRLQMAAAFHDAARLDEGVDRWDADSATLLADFLRVRAAPRRVVAAWQRCLADKDSDPPCSLDQAILHDADALDIQRTQRGRRHFEPARLWLVRQDGDIAQADKDALIRELRLLIDLTDTHDQKLALERAPRAYLRLLQLVVSIHRACDRLPLTNALLGEVLAR